MENTSGERDRGLKLVKNYFAYFVYYLNTYNTEYKDNGHKLINKLKLNKYFISNLIHQL